MEPVLVYRYPAGLKFGSESILSLDSGNRCRALQPNVVYVFSGDMLLRSDRSFVYFTLVATTRRATAEAHHHIFWDVAFLHWDITSGCVWVWISLLFTTRVYTHTFTHTFPCPNVCDDERLQLRRELWLTLSYQLSFETKSKQMIIYLFKPIASMESKIKLTV